MALRCALRPLVGMASEWETNRWLLPPSCSLSFSLYVQYRDVTGVGVPIENGEEGMAGLLAEASTRIEHMHAIVTAGCCCVVGTANNPKLLKGLCHLIFLSTRRSSIQYCTIMKGYVAYQAFGLDWTSLPC